MQQPSCDCHTPELVRTQALPPLKTSTSSMPMFTAPKVSYDGHIARSQTLVKLSDELVAASTGTPKPMDGPQRIDSRGSHELVRRPRQRRRAMGRRLHRTARRQTGSMERLRLRRRPPRTSTRPTPRCRRSRARTGMVTMQRGEVWWHEALTRTAALISYSRVAKAFRC